MSLSALVQFGQRYSRSLLANTNNADIEADLEAVPEQIAQTDKLPTRPRIPAWVRWRTADQELPMGADHPWRIEGYIDSQQPPPDVEALGADALAFYAPFHFYKSGWGIFIRMSGVVYLAQALKGESLGQGDEEFLEVAEAVLVGHEWHHAACEIACTRAELTARRPLYISYFGCSEAAELEEALANAQAIHCIENVHEPVRSRTELWMSTQGPGYRDYKAWTPAVAFSSGCNRSGRYMMRALPGRGPRSDWSLYTFLFRGARNYPSMPVTRIDDLAATSVSVLRPFPREHGIQVFVYSREHPPPHIHVKTLSRENWTRYSWPPLRPLENNMALSAQAEKGLRQYVESYGAQIEERIKAVYGK